jgi:hypothetical protein
LIVIETCPIDQRNSSSWDGEIVDMQTIPIQ